MNDPTILQNKRILVTGGSTGIGRALVKKLAATGAKVMTYGRHEADLAESVANASTTKNDIIGFVADSSNPRDLDAIFEAVEDKLGGLDILVCNAAIGAGPLAEMDEASWRYVIETNLLGYIACAKRALARMEHAGGGHLLFVGSISSAIKAAGESVYVVTKAGIDAFAETLRKEISAERNIRVTVIQPGSVSTDMQECSEEEKSLAIQRCEMLHANDVADTIVYALTRPPSVNIMTLRVEPLVQKTS